MSTTPLMSMTLPVPGFTPALGLAPPGQSWLELLVAALNVADRHNHSPGHGAPISAAGISIDADLPFALHNATALRSTRFTPIALGALGASDLGALIVSGSDLYYVDTTGAQVRLTSGGALAGTPGSISGLASPAAVSYTVGSKLFDLTSSSGVRANLNVGPIAIYDPQAGGKYAQLKVPVGLAGNYAITLPAALPGAQSFLTLDAAGNVAAGVAFANGIGASNVGTLARSNLPAVGQQISASCGAVVLTGSLAAIPNLAVTLTTTGRPIIAFLVPATTGLSMIAASATAARLLLVREDATTWATEFGTTGAGPYLEAAPSLHVIDAPSAGTHTYTVYGYISPGTGTGTLYDTRLAVFEL